MAEPQTPRGERIRVRGLVQGVGFRPTVWRLARDLGARGDVRNDGEGVLIRLWAASASIDAFCGRLLAECPPLGRIDAIERSPLTGVEPPEGFQIVGSDPSQVRTGVVPDAATCESCLAEIRDPTDRRYRYPFANCTHCGPRLSIVRAIPYDRANTSMAVFALCDDCRREYEDPADRRFHAQPNACPVCGPRVWLQRADGERSDASDAIAAASQCLSRGEILAIKGIGGFHLSCDATDPAAVDELRRRKRRYRKAFALMARDLDVVRRYCEVDADEAALLASPAAPIVLLRPRDPDADAPALAAAIAPGQSTLGFMLPYSPLHHLLLETWQTPLVMTSGNTSEEPQCIDNADAGTRLEALADGYLLHDREIVNRVDDSVVRVMDGAPRLLRRARGYAPAPLPLPPGFETAPPILALGGELKNTICILQDNRAILSQHLGDLEDARTAGEFERTIDLYLGLYQHNPSRIAIDRHPDYRSARWGRDFAARAGIDCTEVQHHHAHLAAVLADNDWPREGGRVLGLILDGLGYGTDGTLWGGELLVGDYSGYTRVAHLDPAPMPGGVKAILEPWRMTFAHLDRYIGWDRFMRDHGGLDLAHFMRERPIEILSTMIERRLNTPMTSSCGRLFDAVAGALHPSSDPISYEGQAAIELEAIATAAPRDDGAAYPFALEQTDELWRVDPSPMWSALLLDIASDLPPGSMALCFHLGLADALAALSTRLAERHGLNTIALSGGVFQNRLLFEAVCERLRAAGLAVLGHRRTPSNDGGLALGQAMIAAARV